MIVRRLRRYVFFWGVIISVTGMAQSSETRLGVPKYLVSSRVQKLDKLTTISLVYNDAVQAYIDVYTKNRPEHLAHIISRSKLYFPLFEEYLDKYGLPLELKYLSVVESALDPRAKSSSGAYGLWQFLYQASRMFDLKVTTYVDDRADPALATDAACRYLKYLYDNFNDWSLALAAYNGGIGEVKEAIRKSGGETDYWKIRPYLSAQMRGYVPAFIAVNYVMNHYRSYGIVPGPAAFSFDDLATVEVPGGLSFQQIAEKSKVDMETLSMLNPSYKLHYIPQQTESVRIVVPVSALPFFHKNRDAWSVESHPPVKPSPPVGDISGRVKDWHKVAPGEFFHKIAMAYSCRIEDLMVWNHLKDKNINAGQILIVWKPMQRQGKQLTYKEVATMLR